MTKETYVKPEVRSEILEPGALAHAGSGGTGSGSDSFGWLQFFANPSCGYCCDDD